MADSIKTVIDLNAVVTQHVTGDLQTGDILHKLVKSLVMEDGTSDDQSDLVWSDTRTLAGTSEELDLAGSLTDALGNTITFAEITAILIYNAATTAAYKLLVGGAAATQFVNWVANASDIVQIGPKGLFVLTSPKDGYAVGAGASDKLKIDSGANTISYSIIIVGRSA